MGLALSGFEGFTEKANLPRILDVVATGSWYQHQVASRASPEHPESVVISVNINDAW
jgi:hypothetical protein